MSASEERDIAAEDSIKVVCRFRPLNDSEEKAGSKFVVKFPSSQEDNCISIGVSKTFNITIIKTRLHFPPMTAFMHVFFMIFLCVT